MVFLGTFYFNLDSKNRLMLPAKWRNALTNSIVISKGYDGCLEIRSSSEFEKYSNKLLNNLNPKQKNSRIILRQLLANAADIEMDNNARIVIPSNLINEASLKKEVALIGVGNYVELWDNEKYKEFKNISDETFEEASEAINGC